MDTDPNNKPNDDEPIAPAPFQSQSQASAAPDAPDEDILFLNRRPFRPSFFDFNF